MVGDYEAHKVGFLRLHLPVLKTVTKHYALALDYRTHHLSNRTSCFDKTVSSYNAALAKNAKSQMKAHSFNLSNLICVIGFLATFELASDTNYKPRKSSHVCTTLLHVRNTRQCA